MSINRYIKRSDISQELYKWRKKNRLSVRQAARYLDINYSTLYSYETRRTDPYIHTADTIRMLMELY